MEKILIVIDTSRASGRKFLGGVEKYTSAFADWQVFVKPPDYLPNKAKQAEPWFRMEDIDGLLIRDSISPLDILKIDKPKVINDTQREYVPGTSMVITDSHEIGKHAAEYLLSLGFRNFAYCGFRGLPWSQKRYEAFLQILRSNGITNIVEYNGDSFERPQYRIERWKISEWLKQLPRPLCVFACNDDRAVSILEACKIAGLSVPEEVAVLGVDNDELICNLSSPSLSSIELNFEKAGFLAAQHLDELIRKNARTKVINVCPIEIVTRRSTDYFAIEDDGVVSALIFIKKNFRKPIQICDVVQATYLSRRGLERRFKTYLKRTIKEEIERLRIELIKKKLLNSIEPIYCIAQDIEFSTPEHISRYFKNATGQSPHEFRRKH